MNRALIHRALFVLAIVLASTFAIVRSPVRLGLDLRGGASLILRVKVDDASAAQRHEVVEQTRQNIGAPRQRIRPFRSSHPTVCQPGK